MVNDFIQRTAKVWGVSEERARELLNTDYKKSVRLNKFKLKKSTLSDIKKSLESVESIDWADDCYLVDGKIKPSQLEGFNNGEFIVQNAASFIPVLELDPKPGEDIIDLAAAPGGKSSHIANLSKNKANLTLNDTSRTRFFKMQQLMKEQGVEANFSLRDGRYLSKELGADKFDKILLDAPCSGEANLKPDDYDKWSLKTIKRLSKLQQSLISEAFKMLKPDGTLVYSTCTIAPEENEQVIDYLLRHNLNAKVIKVADYPLDKTQPILKWGEKEFDKSINGCLRLLPSKQCKPFFIAKITKTSSNDSDNSYEILQNSYKI